MRAASGALGAVPSWSMECVNRDDGPLGPVQMRGGLDGRGAGTHASSWSGKLELQLELWEPWEPWEPWSLGG